MSPVNAPNIPGMLTHHPLKFILFLVMVCLVVFLFILDILTGPVDYTAERNPEYFTRRRFIQSGLAIRLYPISGFPRH